MIKKNGGNQKSPNESGYTIQTRVILKPGKGTQCVAGQGKEENRDPIEAIEKPKFWKLKQILNFFKEGGNRILGHKPKCVTPKQASCLWGMHIIFGVGMTMMPAVMGSPPQWSALTRAAGYERTDELNNSGCLEGPVRKIPVVKSGDAKHSNGVGKQCKQNSPPDERKEKHRECGEMDENIRQTPKPLDTTFLAFGILEGFWRWANPLGYGK